MKFYHNFLKQTKLIVFAVLIFLYIDVKYTAVKHCIIFIIFQLNTSIGMPSPECPNPSSTDFQKAMASFWFWHSCKCFRICITLKIKEGTMVDINVVLPPSTVQEARIVVYNTTNQCWPREPKWNGERRGKRWGEGKVYHKAVVYSQDMSNWKEKL